MKLGNPLKTALTHFPSDVLISRHLATCLTRENLATRETEVSTFPCTQTEKDIALARCRKSQRAWRNKKPVLTLSAVTDGEDHPLENENESGRRLCECWRTIFQAREEGPRHHQYEDILRGLGNCVSKDCPQRKYILREHEKVGSNHTVKQKNREKKGSSEGIIQQCELQERVPWAPNFEETTQNEILRQERRARKAAWNLAKDAY